jgi:hypothetical protein
VSLHSTEVRCGSAESDEKWGNKRGNKVGVDSENEFVPPFCLWSCSSC